jgi:hypothetical protein
VYTINIMSSRSLAAARARRAGENAPPVSGNRPITSIGSQAAFAQQTPPTNVRIANQQQQKVQYQQKPGQPGPNQQVLQQQQQQLQQQLQQLQQQQFQQEDASTPRAPFNKIMVADAINIIAVRLKRVEQWIIETEKEHTIDQFDQTTNQFSQDSTVGIDTGLLSDIVTRIDSLEKKESAPVNSEQVTELSEQLSRLGVEVSRHNLIIAKNTEQIFKFERDLVETKDILKTFMMKYDLFAKDTIDKFVDFDYAMIELEKSINSKTGENLEGVDGEKNSNETTIDNSALSSDLRKIEEDIIGNQMNDDGENVSLILSDDLKNSINEELIAST